MTKVLLGSKKKKKETDSTSGQLQVFLETKDTES